jgi:hypothetical protein
MACILSCEGDGYPHFSGMQDAQVFCGHRYLLVVMHFIEHLSAETEYYAGYVIRIIITSRFSWSKRTNEKNHPMSN